MTLATDLKKLNACDDALAWVRRRKFATLTPAWETCPRGDWMLWLAGAAGVDRHLLVLAACECARLALPHTEDPRVLACIETAEAWCRGEATMAELLAARRVAYAAAYAAARATMLRRCATIVRKRITPKMVRDAMRGAA